jgi:hypothetical protein
LGYFEERINGRYEQVNKGYHSEAAEDVVPSNENTGLNPSDDFALMIR